MSTVDALCFTANALAIKDAAPRIYRMTCRTDFAEPGFCIVNLGSSLSSTDFRSCLLRLKQELASIHETTGKTLILLSASRFDQQTSTKPHLDGGPEESLLLLGYEPTLVASELECVDYSRCAQERGLTPKAFLERHNPMFRAGYELLRPFAMRIPCFRRQDFQIACINNSSAPWSLAHPAWQGVLHTATVPQPDENQRRIINSLLLGTAPLGAPDALSDAEQMDFISTAAVKRRGYDKTHLLDDR